MADEDNSHVDVWLVFDGRPIHIGHTDVVAQPNSNKRMHQLADFFHQIAWEMEATTETAKELGEIPRKDEG